MSSVLKSSAIDRKLSGLQARLRAENEASQRNNLSTELNNISVNRRPNQISRPTLLLDGGSPLPPRHEGTPTRSRKELALPFFPAQKRHQEATEIDRKMEEIMLMNGILNINGKKYHTEEKDLEHLGELGNGTCGHVVKMLHRPSETVIAVKQMRRSGNSDENKRIIMDIDVVLKSHDCPYIVQCLGCRITDADVWICMELMSTCFDKLLRRLRKPIPENILGKVTVATVKALHYLKESHGVIHRDVKPSNILLDERGNVKLCDFGISGRLVDSKAKTRSAGCAAYMAPERIDPPDPKKPDYDIRADVWSLGITLVELATGRFPYHDCKTDFEVLTKVLQDDPPTLPLDQAFGPEFTSFVNSCLTKNYRQRPKYKQLLEHPFIQMYESQYVDVATWFAQAMIQSEQSTTTTVTTTSVATNTVSSGLRRFTPPPGGLSQASPTPPRRHGTFNHAQLQPSNHQRHASVPEPLPLPPRTHENAFHRPGVESRLHEPPPTPQRTFPAEPRKRHPSEPPPTNGSPALFHRPLFSPPPLPSGRPTSPLVTSEHQTSAEDGATQTRFASCFNLQLQRRPPAPLPLQTYPPQPPSSPAMFRLNPINTDRFFVDSQSQHQVYYGNTTTARYEPNVNGSPRYDPSTMNGSARYDANINGSPRYDPNSAPRYDPGHTVPPSPPPRLSRGQTCSSESPRMLRRGIRDPTRRSLGANEGYAQPSPSLPRRYISPTPPQPPPRRLSESNSVPGSPQQPRSTPMLRARYHYTPEPQRRQYGYVPDPEHRHYGATGADIVEL